MITIEGTVIDILGYPATPFTVEAKMPATKAPGKGSNGRWKGCKIDQFQSKRVGYSTDNSCRGCQPNWAVKENGESEYAAKAGEQTQYDPLPQCKI